MNKLFRMVISTVVLLVLFFKTVQSQGVAINASGFPASPNAMLDVSSIDKGILIPRIDYNKRPASNVETGMMIFVTTNGPLGNNVFYYYDGAKWLRVKNSEDKQTLTLSADTLKLSESNFVVIGDIFSLIGYTKCNTTYTQVSSDVHNCGSCNNACSFPNAAASCIGGNCGIGQCRTGYGNCNNMSSDGCEINLMSNISNCGSCGNACPPYANGNSGCSSGQCGLTSCNAGYANCNGQTGDGCEINLSSDVNNCGLCGSACPASANATPACISSTCSIAACNTGFANCNGLNNDGCETNLQTSVSNCGACGHTCSATANSNPGCTSGVCTIASCNAGFGNCNGVYADGCETSLSSISNCGACGNACPAAANAAAICTSGNCGFSCNSGFANCNSNSADGCEINLQFDLSNCGACGNLCPARANAASTCTAGNCGFNCNSGFANCNSNNVDGCEINLKTNNSNCGACGTVCPFGKTCSNGTCI